MKQSSLPVQLALVLLAALLAAGLGTDSRQLAHAQSGGISVTGADGTREQGIGGDPALDGALASAQPRVVAAYTRALRRDSLDLLPALDGALASAQPRVVAAYARALRGQELGFRRDLLNDTVPPHVTATPRIERRGDQFFMIIAVDEFATCVIRYGTQPGVYTDEVSATLFSQPVEVKLGDTALNAIAQTAVLQPGVRYHYRYSLTDQSGNTFESEEQTFTIEPIDTQVYLPLLRR